MNYTIKMQLKYLAICTIILTVILIACLMPVHNDIRLTFAEELSGDNVVANDTTDIQSSETDVIEYLNGRKAFYSDKLYSATGESEENIAKIISEIDEAIVAYEEHLIVKSSDDNTFEVNVSELDPSSSEEFIVKLGVKAIAIGFETMGWDLAAELLWFNLSNETLNIDYHPINGDVITHTSEIADDIAYSYDLSNSFNTENHGIFGDVYECDMYYSLGKFYYNKTDAGDGNVNISILDRYDWEKKDYKDGVAEALINIVARAQELGVVTPFYTRIDITIPGYVPFDWEYTDNGVAITGVASDITTVNLPVEIHDFRVRLPEGGSQPTVKIKEISNNAFKDKAQITSVTMPNTVTEIGNNAFAGCVSLININMSSTLENIGDNAFEGCNGLVSINLPSTLTNIGVMAFKGCNALTSMNLPAALNYLGYGAFMGCNNLDLTVSSDNPLYLAEDNVVYNREKTEIFAATKIPSIITIPDTVTKINSYAFADNSNLENIHFNNAIIIGANAFADCINLKKIYFYSIYTSQLGSNAFANDVFNLYVPYNYKSNYAEKFADYSVEIKSIEVQVSFKVDENVINTKNVYYGSLVNFSTIPTKEGYTFEGWVDEKGEKYIDADGNGVKLVDKTENFELDAHWAIKSYKIKIKGNGFITWLGPTGLSEAECEIEYGALISSINLIAEFKVTKQAYKEGYIFDHFEYENQKLNWQTIPDLGPDGIEIEIIPQWIKEKHTIYFSTLCNETIGAITKQYGESISIPTDLARTGYYFKGWYQNSNYSGDVINWVTMPDLTPKTDNNTYTDAQNNGSVQLYAKWDQVSYSIVYNSNGGTGSMASSQHLYHEEKQLSACDFTRFGYYFTGWSTTNNNKPEFGNCEIVKGLTESTSITLYACWEKSSITIDICYVNGDATTNSLPESIQTSVEKVITYGSPQTISAPSIEGYSFVKFVLYGGNPKQTPYKEVLASNNNSTTLSYEHLYETVRGKKSRKLYVCYEEDSCVTEGTMITLADGTQKAVEELTGEEELLVWNMFTGEFDSAPILFIDSDPERYYEVVNLYFSDGTTTKVVSEHAFWDIDLNEYVFLRNDAAQYIGHWFNKQTVDENGNMINTEVQLINVVVQEEYTTAWSPVTYGYLCYYVNGMLSMPGATTGLINIFEVDAETMTINQEAYLEDVEEYGLFTYEEFNAICPVPEIIFEAFGGQYLKVSLGKGLITWDELETLIARYAEFWD